MTIAGENDMKQMNQYVEGLPDNCFYEDGYVCSAASDSSFYQQTLNNQLIPASYLVVWPSAYQAFLALPELTEQQKKLMHYKIGFAEDGKDYVVFFSPLRMPYIEAGKPLGISNISYGKAVKIWINKSSLLVTKHLFLK